MLYRYIGIAFDSFGSKEYVAVDPDPMCTNATQPYCVFRRNRNEITRGTRFDLSPKPILRWNIKYHTTQFALNHPPCVCMFFCTAHTYAWLTKVICCCSTSTEHPASSGSFFKYILFYCIERGARNTTNEHLTKRLVFMVRFFSGHTG